jgi:DNA-binding transcriptional MerR regulator
VAYTIKEVAKKTGISAHTLRFYEKEGVLPFVERDEHGNRIYNDYNLSWVELLVALRSTGMPLNDLKRYVVLYKQGESTLPERKEMMLNHRNKVEEMKNQLNKYLEKINYKLALYDVQERSPFLLP